MEYASGINLQMFHAIRSNIYFNERLDRNLWRNSWSTIQHLGCPFAFSTFGVLADAHILKCTISCAGV